MLADFKPGDWIDVILWDDHDFWQVLGMRNGPTPNPTRRQIYYTLPIRKVLKDSVELLIPDSDRFTLLGKYVNSFIEQDKRNLIGYVYLDIEVIQKYGFKKSLGIPCKDCGWYCFQQCFTTKKSYKPEDII